MRLEELKKGLWGYRKDAVFQYITQQEEQFTQKMAERDAQMEQTSQRDRSRIQELEQENRALKEELTRLRGQQDQISQAILDARSSADALMAESRAREEEAKGNALTQAAYQAMKADSDKGLYNFAGNVESSHIFSGKVADVIVCDGFVGNTVLKMAEGLYRINLALGGRNAFWDAMNYENVGGTPVLGVNAPVIIGHGCSSPKAIKSMILSTEQVIKAGLTAKLQQAFKN